MNFYIKKFISFFEYRGGFKWLSDKHYLQLCYWKTFDKPLNLSSPKTFNEKLQWLKLYDRNPKYTQMVDKYEAKKYVANIIGEQYIVPTLGVWDSFDEIDFSKLPNQFVLKCTHDCGGLVICKDKNSIDYKAAKKKINKSLKTNYFYEGREWPYKNVKPRIIAEKYICDETGVLNDYKFTCFNGSAENVMVCCDRAFGDVKFYFFDKEWNFLRLNKRGAAEQEGFTLPKPDKIEEMFKIASKLSEGIPYVRVDLYFAQEKIYFSELTFYPASGFDTGLLPETDIIFGENIDLSLVET